MTDRQHKHLERILEIAIGAILLGVVALILLGVYSVAELVF